MTVDYAQDRALKAIKDRVKRLELTVARTRPAGGVTVGDSGGFYGSPDSLTLEELLALIGAGLAPGAFLSVIGGGKGTVEDVGAMGADETFDLANANKFVGLLDDDTAITTVGWTNGKDCQILLQLTADGDHLPTVGGVTWVTDAPTTVADGDTLQIALWSHDGGTVIWGAVIGGSSGTAGLITLTDGVVVVFPTTTASVPLGGIVDNGSGDAGLRFLTSVYGGQAKVVTASPGATYDVDCSLGNVFDLTLTANLTYTISNPPPAGVSSTIYLVFRQGTGAPYTVTHAAEVDFQDTDGTTGGADPTLHTAEGALNIIELTTVDGGVSWGGADTAGTFSLIVKDDGTPLATGATTLDFVGPGVTATGSGSDKTITIPGGATASDTGIWRPLMDSGSGMVITDGATGEAVMGFGPA